MDGLFRRLAKYDVSGRAKGDFVQSRTSLGAAITLGSFGLIVSLLISEFVYYREVRVENHLRVDTEQGEKDVIVNMEVDFYKLKCNDVGLGFRDSKGNQYTAEKNHVQNLPWTSPEGEEGCKLKGSLEVKQVAGQIYMTLGKLFHHDPGQDKNEPHNHMITMNDFVGFNCSHTIRHLSFGPEFPGQGAPLNGHTSVLTEGSGGVQFQYIAKVVPTNYVPLGVPEDSDKVTRSEQFSATSFTQEVDLTTAFRVQPGVFIKYEFSPIRVDLVETRRTFLTFLTSVCGIVGGVYTVAGLLNSGLHTWIASLRKEA